MDTMASRASLARPGGLCWCTIGEWLGSGFEVVGNREQLLGIQFELAACSLLGDQQPLNE